MRRQLKRLGKFIESRRANVAFLYTELNKKAQSSFGLPIDFPLPELEGGRHAFYVCPFIWDEDKAEGIHRDKYLEAVRAELTYEDKRIDRGIPIGGGYIQPLYRMPLFQNQTHWSIKGRSYDEELPTVEKLWKDKFFLTLYHGLPLWDADKKDIVDAFCKVWEHRDELRRK
jgi:dTDP-4-amino-4,6-dideoxygalactose transaminase